MHVHIFKRVNIDILQNLYIVYAIYGLLDIILQHCSVTEDYFQWEIRHVVHARTVKKKAYKQIVGLTLKKILNLTFPH